MENESDPEPSFALNIVAIPAVAPKNKPSKKRKKFNKKGKRSAKQKTETEKTTTTPRSNLSHEVTDQSTDLDSGKKSSDSSTLVSKTKEVEQGSAQEDEPVPKPNKKRPRTEPSTTSKEVKDPETKVETQHRKHAADPPANSAAHAAYLAEFHARPYELDRRAGAVRRLPESKPSQHLHEESVGTTWNSLGITNPLLQRRIPHDAPTNIQCQSVPAILKATLDSGILVQAETGSGKTLAYALPCLQACLRDTGAGTPRITTPRCLILVPTRELAYQTLACLQPLLAGTPVVPGILVGGVQKGSSKHRKSEKAALRKGWAVLIATASRVLDHIKTTQVLQMGDIHTIVLDEADRLVLDPAHRAAIHEVWEHLPQARTILVSATLPKDEILKALPQRTKHYTLPKDWKTVTAMKVNDKSGPNEASQSTAALPTSNPHQLQHFHLVVHAKLRWPALVACLLTSKHKKTVVFCSTCAAVDYLGQILPRMLPEEHKVYCLHGNMSLQQRQSNLAPFTDSLTNTSGVLISTDVAGRGLNLGDTINNVTIIQYDPPSCSSDYVHRAGRAARAGAPGECLLFLLPAEVGVLSALDVQTTAMSLSTLLEKAAKTLSDKKGQRPADAFATQIQQKTESTVEELSLQGAAAKAFGAHVRAYPVKERLLKPYFLPKALHLGHVARSFGWKGQPSELTKVLQQQNQPKQRQQPKKRVKRLSEAAKMLEGMGSL